MILKAVKNHRSLYVYASIGILIVISFASHAAIVRQLNNWKLLPEPERLTELYFSNPNTLPTTYTANTNQDVSFKVHNLEYKTVDYHYEIIEVADGSNQGQVLTEGSFILKQNQLMSRNVPLKLADMGKHVQIEIELSPVNETISYGMTQS
jgi:uncharacterized membrane protein